jgi:HTH-type transcriptional regulator/antitoxin HigA
MINTTQIKAAKKFGLGYFIREQMELRNWKIEDLAKVLGFPVNRVIKLMDDKQPLTSDDAQKLGAVFNTSAEYWVNLNSSYQ